MSGVRGLECAFFDADSFFVSVECKHLGIHGKPVVVGGQAVVSASTEAKKLGIKAGVSMAQVRRAHPEVLVVEPRIGLYRTESRAMMEVLERAGLPMQVESIDEAYIDLRGYEDSIGGGMAGVRLAAMLRRDVKRECGLSMSVGVSRGRVTAKMAADDAKPDGLLTVSESEMKRWLGSKSVSDVPGVGAVTARELHSKGVVTVQDAERAGREFLRNVIGQSRGEWLWGVIQGERDTPGVDEERGRKSRGAETTLREAISNVESVREVFEELCADVCGGLLEEGLWTRGVRVHVRDAAGDKSRQQRTHSTRAFEDVRDVAFELLGELLKSARSGVRLIGVTCYDLTEHEDLRLFDEESTEVLPWSVDGRVGEVRGHPVFGEGLLIRRRGNVWTASFSGRRREIEDR